MTAEPNFEAAIAELDRLLRELEGDAGTLEESLAKYARGVELVAICSKRLDAAERTIQQLTGVDADGNPVLTPFAHTATGSGGSAGTTEPAPKKKTKI
jgi:exodeoxyribonuclease VII small subunit